MPRLTKQLKQDIEEIPVPELQKLVMQAAAKDREFYDKIKLQYGADKPSEEEFFEEMKGKILNELYSIGNRGILQKNLVKAIAKAIKHINHYAKVSKNKVGEAELLAILLEEIFENHSNELSTCWTVFDSKLAITTNRLYNLVLKKLHEDYLIEFKSRLNGFLKILHTRSNHLDYVIQMPKEVEN